MTQPVSRPPTAADAARSPSDEPITEFVAHDSTAQPGSHSPIEREIERSERASAALAATRALARAAFTDSQLAAEDAAAAAGRDAAEDAADTEWVRTEYVALEHTLPPDDEARRDTPPRSLVGGSFNPGIASQQGRTYPGASMADASLKTRTGAQAQFHHEARHAPRPDPVQASTGHPGRPVVTPSQAAAPSRGHAPARPPARDGLRFLLAAGLGAVVVLAGGGLAWRAGLLTHAAAPMTAATSTPTTPAAEPAAATAQAEAARVLAPTAPQEIPVTPAAGPAPPRSGADVDAALAAAARAAAVPADSVRAAGPTPVARPQPLTAPLPVPAPATTPAAAAHGKPSVAEAIANAQAKADRFLSAGSAPATGEGKQAP
jgi:hypothetical protein